MSKPPEENLGAMTLDKRSITINKKWVISSKMGQGGFGALYIAEEKYAPENKVIIKTVPLLSHINNSSFLGGYNWTPLTLLGTSNQQRLLVS